MMNIVLSNPHTIQKEKNILCVELDITGLSLKYPLEDKEFDWADKEILIHSSLKI